MIITTPSLAVNAMFDLLVPCQSIQSAEALLVIADLTANLLAVRIMNRVLMTSQIVRARKDGVARLASRWVETSTAMGARLTGKWNVHLSRITWVTGRLRMIDLAMLLELGICLKALIAPFCGASVRTSVSLGTLGLLKPRPWLYLLMLLRLLLRLLMYLLKVSIEGRFTQVGHGHGLKIGETWWQKSKLWAGMIREGSCASNRPSVTSPPAGEASVVLF
jgi:hypothetical protein